MTSGLPSTAYSESTFNMSKYTEFKHSMETKFPKLFPNPYGGFEIGEGWWPIVEALCNQIQHHIDQVDKRREYLLSYSPDDSPIPDPIPQVVVDQVKEKFGGLRFYYHGGDEYIGGLVTMAESWASRTCEQCGNAGKLRGSSWLYTACAEHTKLTDLKHEV